MTLIYRFLGHNGLRTAASETLASIVSKKMHSADKLELIALLNLTQVVESLEADEDLEFSEAMARLVNVQGLELTRIIVEVILRCVAFHRLTPRLRRPQKSAARP